MLEKDNRSTEMDQNEEIIPDNQTEDIRKMEEEEQVDLDIAKTTDKVFPLSKKDKNISPNIEPEMKIQLKRSQKKVKDSLKPDEFKVEKVHLKKPKTIEKPEGEAQEYPNLKPT